MNNELKLIGFYTLLSVANVLNGQAINDICENASIIKGEPYNSDSVWLGDGPFGGLIWLSGRIDENTGAGTREAVQILSDECTGYTDQTTPEFVDVWYKKKLIETSVVLHCNLSIYIEDTTHIALYYGTCDSLFQYKCFTLTQGYYKGDEPEFWISHKPVKSDDSLYVQISYPKKSTPFTRIVYFGGDIGFSIGGLFQYSKPAIRNGSTSTWNSETVTLKISPNPTSGEFTVETSKELSGIEIINLKGEQIMAEMKTNSGGKFSINEMPKGLHIAKLFFSDGSMQHRRIIKLE